MKVITRKSKSIISFALVLIMLLSTGLSVQAGNNKDALSNATFNFTNEGDTEGPTNPVDPEAPEHNIDPDPDEDGDTGVTNNKGRLRIDYVSNFAFGTGEITSDRIELFADLISANANHTESGRIKVPNFVQVSDLRGTGDGWTLQVKQDNHFRVKEGRNQGEEIIGTTIYLNNILANTINEDEKVNIPNQSIELIPSDEYTNIMVAGTAEGMGTHVAYFGEYKQGAEDSALTSVMLEIPADAKKLAGSFESSLTWVLSSTPGNGGGDNGGGDNGGGNGGGDDSVELDHIVITSSPEKTAYFSGETFDPEGMIVHAYYTDDTSAEVLDYTYTPNGALSTDDSAITVSYTEGDITKTATQAITVDTVSLTGIAITSAPAKTTYIEGDTFNSAGMEVTASYNDGSTKKITDYTYSPNGVLGTSDKSITVSYTENNITKTAAQAITVSAKALTGIAITSAPTKTAYIEGNTFSSSGMVVTASYNDGSTKKVTNYTYTPNGTLRTSDKTITVSYTENNITKTATQAITVSAKTLTSIAVTTNPKKTQYVEGENFDATGMVVTAYYNNGTNAKVTTYSWLPGTLTPTNNTITIYYTENSVQKTTSLKLTVKSKDQGAIDSIDDKDEFDEIEIGDDTWIILSKSKSKGTAELLHKSGLTQTRQYNNHSNSGWNWEGSTLRSYLNGTFYKTLSKDFRNSIQTVEKVTMLPNSYKTQRLDETVYLLSASEYVTYNTKFGGTLYGYGLNNNIPYGWWMRDADTYSANGVYYVISSGYGAGSYAAHACTNLQGVRPVVTVKYK